MGVKPKQDPAAAKAVAEETEQLDALKKQQAAEKKKTDQAKISALRTRFGSSGGLFGGDAGTTLGA